MEDNKALMERAEPITHITEKQKQQLSEYMDIWLRRVYGATDIEACNSVIKTMYSAMGIKQPLLLLHFTSPLLSILASSLFSNRLKRQLYSQLGNQLGNQLSSQLGSQLDSQLGSQLGNQLDSQLSSQLGNQLGNQLDSQLSSQLGNQLGNQLYSQLDSRLSSQLGNQLDSQLDSQLSSQLDSQLDSRLGNQLYSQLYSQLGSQLDSQLDSQLYSQLSSQLDSQLGNQLGSQLGNQLYSQLGNQLYSQLDSRLSSQLKRQLKRQLGSQLKRQLKRQLDSQLYSQLGRQLGGHYSVVWGAIWACLYDYAQTVLGIKFDRQKLDLFREFTSSIHSIIPYPNVCFYSEKPIKCSYQGTRLHNETGMAVEYADGWGWYALNGVVMKREYVLTPAEELTPGVVLKETNVDQRRELIRKIGVVRLKQNAKLIEKVGDYELLDMKDVFAGIPYAPFLWMKNPSVENTYHLEGVSPECRTVEQALNWRAGNLSIQWKPEELN